LALDFSARRIHVERVGTQVPKAGITFEGDGLGGQQPRHSDRAAIEAELIVYFDLGFLNAGLGCTEVNG
jgi:hypothetical protein